MKVTISDKLNEIYKKQHKNYDYAINSVLDSFDPKSFVDCFNMVKGFNLAGTTCEINIGDDVVERMISDLEMDSINNKTVELLLWLGAVLPEV